jgi:hypothetical protein
MLSTENTNNRHLQIIGVVLLFVGVITWMRFTKKEPNVRYNRNLDALVATKPKRRSQSVSYISGSVVGNAVSADSIEVWSGRGLRLVKQKLRVTKPFFIKIPKASSEDIAVVARSNGRLVTVVPGSDVNDFTDVRVGSSASVTFSTRFVDATLQPIRTSLSGTVSIGDVSIPIDTQRNIICSERGDLQVFGLPQSGFVSFEIHNPEHAQTFSLTNIALRSDKLRTFPNVKVFPSNEIRGRVINTEGNPVSNAAVVINGNVHQFRMSQARTDAQGMYTFSRLPNGVYSVNALSGDIATVCSAPISQIRCEQGSQISLSDLTLRRGKVVKFVIFDSNNNRTQPVFLKVSGEVDGKRWVITHLLLRDEPTKVLLPKGLVHFSASQQPRNGMMPFVRNIDVSPTEMEVDPSNNQTVTVRILPRRS